MPDIAFGPNTRQVRALLASLEHARLLRPDASMAALDDAALRWLEERADEHLAALAPFADTPLGPARIACVRAMDEAFEHEEDAWEPFVDASRGPTGPLASALFKAVDAAQKAALAHRHRAYPMELSTAVQAAVRAAIERTTGLPWQLSGSAGPMALRPGLASVWRQAEWLYAFGEARPSPFAPLVAIWFRGVWPLALPSGELLVYVPTWSGPTLHVAAQGPTPSEIPRRVPRSATTTTALHSLERCGFGPVPTAVGSPLPVPFQPFAPIGQTMTARGAGPSVRPGPSLEASMGEAWNLLAARRDDPPASAPTATKPARRR